MDSFPETLIDPGKGAKNTVIINVKSNRVMIYYFFS